jgi:uncharacterized membrane protein (UPF0127 family)
VRFSPQAQNRIAVTAVAVTSLLLVGALVYGIVRDDDPKASVPGDSPLADALSRTVPGQLAYEGWTVARVKVDDRCLDVVVADEPSERNQGLRGATAVGPYDGMLFVQGSDSDAAFTMAGTLKPIFITWYSVNGTPVDRRRMTPCSGSDLTCPAYFSHGRYRFALERFDGPSSGAIGSC